MQSSQRMEKPLPEGWRWEKLSNLGHFESGGTPPKENANYWGGKIPFVTGADITDISISSKNARAFLTKEGLLSGKTAICKPDTVLFVTRTRVGRVGIATEEMGASQDLTPLICNQYLLPEYLCRYLHNISEILIENCRGATIQGLTRDFIESIQVPLPPLPEQQRIAARLREQMKAVDEARQAAEAQLKAAKQLQAAYLREIFDEEKIDSWLVTKLGDVGEIISGITLGRKLKNERTYRVPYLRVANVKDGYLDLSDVKKIEATEIEIEKLRLQKGDLLLTEGGDADKLGRGTFWDNQIDLCLHQNHIFRVRLPETQFLPSFVSIQIGSYYGKHYFFKHAKQTTGIATINQKVLRAFPFLAPPLSEQQSIVNRFSELATAIDATQDYLINQLAAINQLPAALLRQAFSGAL